MEKPNYRNIAKRAGVSLTTVSFAMRNSPKISQATREKVAKAAAELGYRRNPLVEALMSRISSNRDVRYQGNFAALCGVNPRGEMIFATRFRNGAEQRAAQAGYQIDLFGIPDPIEDLKAWERLRRTLVNRSIRGVLVAPWWGSRELPEEFFRDFAAAVFGHVVRKPVLHRAETWHYESTRKALEQLSRRDYRRVGLLSLAGIHEGIRHQVFSSYVSWSYENEHQVLEPLVLESFGAGGDVDRFRAWVEEHDLDAILVGHSPSRALEMLGTLGLRVPEDIGLACLNTEPSENVCGMNIHPEQIGTNVVDLITGQIIRNEFGLPERPKLVLSPSDWIEGDTLRKPG